jgi:methylmalonyl-CoA mutase N-terminal domain/subunit
MTDEIERRVWEYIGKIDELGGAISAIEQQYYQTQIAESAYKYQKAIEQREKIVVGVNEYVTAAGEPPPLLRIDEAVRSRQIEKLGAVKAARDQSNVKAALAKLQDAARGGSNMIPPMLAAVESYATVGEISDALRVIWGVYDK